MEDVIPVEELIIKEELDDDIKVRGAAEVDGSVRVDERQRQKQPLVAETGGGGQEVEAEERAIRGKEEPVMYACTLCVKQYRTCTALRSHLSRLHRVASAPGLRCRLCGAVGQSKATLRRHMRRSHSLAPTRQEELLRKCSECGEGVPSLSSLYSHLRSSHSDVLHHYHHCHLCPALVRSRPSLIRHCRYAIHSSTAVSRCMLCIKSGSPRRQGAGTDQSGVSRVRCRVPVCHSIEATPEDYPSIRTLA
ncbi:hypothetical protein OTU49_013127 [Cherax quadricarinatus]|uniref:C2H2-type domain-containing protein n=1 Tax=Cherax quadricarinatus TaxID=27406 RepID=A0AAW0VUH8_CHEQU